MNKLKNSHDAFTALLSTGGIVLSVEDITQVLNLVLLIVSLVNICIVLGLRLYSAIKNHNIQEVKEACEEAKDGINEINRNS